MHPRNSYITVIAHTHTHTHTLAYFIHDSDPSKTLLNPCTYFLYILIQVYVCVCVCDFHDFILFNLFGTFACIENTTFFCARCSGFRSIDSIDSRTERRRVLLWMMDHAKNSSPAGYLRSSSSAPPTSPPSPSSSSAARPETPPWRGSSSPKLLALRLLRDNPEGLHLVLNQNSCGCTRHALSPFNPALSLTFRICLLSNFSTLDDQL